jgi:amino acid transporter
MIFGRIKRLLLGQPLSNQMMAHERISKRKALAVLSSDALSSVAYATEEVLIPLSAFSMAAMNWSIPISLGIAFLLTIVILSYRQTIDAYPGGGGAYLVAQQNLGIQAGLVAGAALLVDYVLTVAVSTAAGVENIAAAFPVLAAHKELIGVAIIFLVMLLNLRGVAESATIFAIPTYIFLLSFVVLIGVSAWRLLTGEVVPAAPLIHETYPEAPLFLLLYAFSSGCTALTGVEAISNAVPMFRPDQQRNAKVTMAWMGFILGTLFLSITFLCHVYGISPKEGQTAVSLLSAAVFGSSWMFYLLQGATAMILILAANTSYAGFPRLSSLLAKDRYLPRQLASVGDRLVFSNGILGLSLAAMFLLVMFKGDTHHLIPLYAIGVFLSFTLCQAGMVLHHNRLREPGWIRSLIINAIGTLTTFVVLVVVGMTKFSHGAWMVIILIPVMVIFFNRIHKHYLAVGKELSLVDVCPPGNLTPYKQTVIVPISGIHRGVVEALRYALSISEDVRAVYVEIDPDTTERMQKEWVRWAHEVPFVVLRSPYRSVIQPLLEYIDDIEQTVHSDMITVVIPEFVTAKWRHQVLHNQTAFLIRTALLLRQKKVVTSIRYHLKGT